jgi:UDP-GlcNAc:undecaprenyl-phosphate/decaprenyl-phosphate GlcNAc-1-phosphate transferase
MGLRVTKAWTIFLGAALLAATAMAQQKPQVKAPEPPTFKTFQDRESYAMGIEMLRNLKRQGFDFDLDMVIKGMKDANSGGKLALSEEEILESLNISASQARVLRTSDQLVAGQENKKAEVEFLAENKEKKGVVTLPSGLQYKILSGDAEGKKPTPGDTVAVHYRGALLDGTQFESTYSDGHPASIGVSDPHVIAGLREALKLMPVGAKWQLFIPSRLAYGQRPAGTVIGPYSMLIYELELLAIK